MISIVFMLFVIMGAVSAADSINVSDSEDSNLIKDSDESLSSKLEISNGVSISQTNIVNSHDDNLGNYDVDVLNGSEEDSSRYQSASEDVLAAGETTSNQTTSSAGEIAVDSSNSGGSSTVGNDDSGNSSAEKLSTKIKVSDTHYTKSATYFKVTLKDTNGNPLKNQKVTLKVKKKTYSAYTNKNGVASIKTAALAMGSYTVKVKYGGSSNYTSSSLKKKVKVASSLSGNDLTKYYGTASKYKVKFWKGNSVLANKKVTFKVNGKTYTKTTSKKGVAKLNINLAVGKYTVTAVNPSTKEKTTNKIVVKKDTTSFKFSDKSYIVANKQGSFTVTLKSAHGALLKDKHVTFTYENKTVTAKTNANGKATITIPALALGTYDIHFRYTNTDGNYYSASDSAKLISANPTTKISASTLQMKYNDGSKFKVMLTNAAGSPLANKDIKFKINGVTKTSKTNANGIAKFKIKNINPGLHKVSFSHSKKSSIDYAQGTGKVIITKADAKIKAKDLSMEPGDGSTYNVVVKNKAGKVLKGVFVKTTIKGKSYLYKTDSKGVAKLKINKGVGYYAAYTVVADPCYKSAAVSKHVLVKGNKFVGKDIHVSSGSSATYSVKLVNAKNKAVKNADVEFTFEGKTSTVKTDSNGIAKIKLGVLSKGNHAIKYKSGSVSDSSKISVVDKVSIKNVLAASKTVKKYISKHSKLPSTVKVGKYQFTTAEYMYLASKAIVKLKSGSKSDIVVKEIKKPANPKKATNLGYLSGYLAVAKKVVKTAESKGKMPNSVSSKIGTIGYKGLVSAFSRVLVSYDNNKKMPSYVAVKSLSGSSSAKVGNLNSKNTISNLAAYLAASANCEVNNAQIKELVAKLTKDCKTEKEKADKIFKYVRDTVSYSFYYDTKYGASGTLKAKTGNCVDHSHLLVAMYRASGLAARYVHGKCTFSSGSTYGHVWAQVLIGNTWTVADATSSRNSLGNVVNWNTNSYKLNGYYASLPF